MGRGPLRARNSGQMDMDVDIDLAHWFSPPTSAADEPAPVDGIGTTRYTSQHVAPSVAIVAIVFRWRLPAFADRRIHLPRACTFPLTVFSLLLGVQRPFARCPPRARIRATDMHLCRSYYAF
jgi:hypothetical protein